jgi:hypothetical protein
MTQMSKQVILQDIPLPQAVRGLEHTDPAHLGDLAPLEVENYKNGQ